VREDGTRVDKVLLTKNTALTPSGLGGGALACSETPPTLPSAPTMFVANDGVGQVAMTWVDTSSNETGFKVERKLQGQADTSYVVVGMPAANATSFTDMGVAAGVYTYRVKSTNAAGDAPSNADDATVTGGPAALGADHVRRQRRRRPGGHDLGRHLLQREPLKIERKGRDSPTPPTRRSVPPPSTPPPSPTQRGRRRLHLPGQVHQRGGRLGLQRRRRHGDLTAAALGADDVRGQRRRRPGRHDLGGHLLQRDGFKVERKPQGSPDTSYTQVGAPAANATSFTDSGVAAGVYTYRVKSTNANGDSPSNTDDATVTAASVSINQPGGQRHGHHQPARWHRRDRKQLAVVRQTNFAVGNTAFGDRTYTIDAVSASATHLLGKPWVRPAADSKNYTATSPPLGTATVNGSFVFIAVDRPPRHHLPHQRWLREPGLHHHRQRDLHDDPHLQRLAEGAHLGATFTFPTVGATTAPCYPDHRRVAAAANAWARAPSARPGPATRSSIHRPTPSARWGSPRRAFSW
jgi:hypothetical protein